MLEQIKTKEFASQIQVDNYNKKGPVKLGWGTTHIWRTDPRRLLFCLARYKFVAKMLTGKKEVLEIGCGDAFGTMEVLQEVDTVHGIDFEPEVIKNNQFRLTEEGVTNFTCSLHDMTDGPINKKFDAAYSLDCIEHIPPEKEKNYMENIISSLKEDAVCIIGCPNITAHKYASEGSRLAHVNLKDGNSLRELMLKYFENVFIFGMNDEVLHTGFHKMAHYVIAIGVRIKNRDYHLTEEHF